MKKAAALLIIILLMTASFITGCALSKPREASPDQKGATNAATQSDGSKTSDVDQKNSVESTKGKNTAPAGEPSAKPGVKRDSGRYVGQIDNNFIEIKISGVPDGVAARSFMLGDKVKGEFEKYRLKKDDQVQFSYTENSSGQKVITEIKRLSP